MSYWEMTQKYRDKFPIVIVHRDAPHLRDGEVAYEMRDTFGRRIYSGPEERWPEDDPRWYDRMNPERCDDSGAEDGCRQSSGHMGVCVPTPEMARDYYAWT